MAAFFRKQVDVQWISEGPDCLLASSINFIIVLWHGYYLALLLRHPIPRSHTPSAALYSPPSLSTTSTTNRGASDISWERQEARCVLAWCRPTAVLHSDLLTLRVLTPISSTLVRLPVTDGLRGETVARRTRAIVIGTRLSRKTISLALGSALTGRTSTSTATSTRQRKLLRRAVYLGAVKELLSFGFKSTAFEESTSPPGCA
ncbi:hypothetical protein C8F01DRAFT_479086 [Mycena amicta]|nr:hypothetical protein C8F01DRAFT_479086 [Mycena amicta]